MPGNKTIWILGLIILAVMTMRISPAVQALGRDEAAMHTTAEQVEALMPFSLQLVNEAIAVLDQGWSGMSQGERELFLQIYDPAGTGEVDAQYVMKVSDNYRKIRATLAADMTVVSARQGAICAEQRLFFTDLSRLYVCPYLLVEDNEGRKARNLIHEVAHMALRVVDRPYYDPRSEQYAELTPDGARITKAPLIGRVAREMLRGDTLYHPDAYAHFALLNAGFTYICLDV